MALKDIIGQEKALRILLGTLGRNRIPSSMLMSGDTGIGKRLTALNYAKAINCSQPVDFDCCDKCSSCRKIESGVHPDVISIFPENDEIRIDAVRKIDEMLSFKAFEGRKKIVIIDDAETMNINAANAFLKTLEEPPPDSLILLISSSPDNLPDTIKSRCMQVRFYPLPLEGCKKVISKKTDTKDMRILLNIAMGRPGIVLSGDVLKEKEWSFKLLKDMIQGESKNIWEDRNAMKLWLDMSCIVLRDTAVFKITGKETDLICGDTYKTSGLQNVIDAYQRLQMLKGLLDFNPNKSISWNYVSNIMRNA
jgi:DNA polymerase-3 subunit delta'